VLENTIDPPYELIVVDNGSRDGSRSYLRTLERRFANVRVLLNGANDGFPAACNQALAAARGDVFVLLNSDTIVPPGWLGRLVDAASDPSVGLAGPVTNRIGNEAEIPTDYTTYGEFLELAREVAGNHSGGVTEIRMPAMFCVALRRDVHASVGPLDERFGPGTLEDDDYAERVSAAGLRSICREDVLVHHFGEGSLGRLFVDGGYSRLLDENRRKFEQKWGWSWQPYARRRDPEYESLCVSIRRLVETHVPARAGVLVVSRGDEELVSFADRRGWHFPQVDDGGYAGHHPPTAVDAIAELERLRAVGAGYLVVPHPSRWWLEHYAEFTDHLHARYSQVLDSDACVVFNLAECR
jgi:GT2 family glycosyltransferase